MNLNVIRTLTIRSKAEGVTETTAALKGLQSAHDGVAGSAVKSATVTDVSSKRQLSIAQAYQRQTLALDENARMQDKMAKSTLIADRALQQGAISQAEHAKRLTLINDRYGLASVGTSRFGAAIHAANDNLRSFAQSAGPVGSVLSAFGPWGIAAAAGIGAVALALHQMASAALALADRAGKLKDFAETTGFTVIELQALEKAGAQVGVSSEAVTKSLERFSVAMVDIKLRTGETYEKLLAINPALARQVSEATSLSNAYELVSKAIKGTDVERANQIARAFFGRGGVEQTRLMRVVGDAAGLKGVIDQLHQTDVITAKQAERWDELGDKINENMKAAKQNIASIFTEPVLEALERFSKAFLELSRAMKTFEVSERLQKVMDFFSNPITQGAIAGALAGGRAGPVGAAVGAVVGGGSAALFSHADAEQARQDIERLTFELNQLQLVKAGASRKILETVDPAQVQQYAAILERTSRRILEIQKEMPGPRERTPVRIDITPFPQDGADRAAERAAEAAKAQEALRIATIASYNEMARWMSVIGGAATMAERYELATRKLAAAKAEGKINEEQHTRAIEEQKQQLEQRLGVANMEALTLDKLAQIREVAAKAGLSDEQKRLAVSIALRESKEKEFAAWQRANPELSQAADTIKDMSLDLVKAALAGQHMGDALVASLDKIASKLLDKAFQDALMALVTMDPAMAAKAGVEAAVAVGISLFTGEEKKRKAEREATEKAEAAWRGLAKEFAAVTRDLQGGTASSIQTRLDDMWDRVSELIRAATAAKDFGAVNKLMADVGMFAARQVSDFQKIAGQSINALAAGSANDSPQRDGMKRAMSAAEELKGFIADVERSFGGLNGIVNQSVIDAARDAAQKFALSMLDLPKEMSETERAIETLMGTANGLTQSLIDLGMSSAEAAKAIDERLNASLKKMAENFTADLQRELNEVSGKGFINELNDLVKATAQQRTDAALLPNVDTSLIDRLFTAQAQKIVDNAGLVGESFTALINLFPQLTGLVHESTDALKQQADVQRELAEAAANFRRSIQQYLDGLAGGTQSFGSPSSTYTSAKSAFETQLALAQGNGPDRDAARASITQYADALLAASKNFNASNSVFAADLQHVRDTLGALPDAAAVADPIVEAVNAVTDAVETGNATLTAQNNILVAQQNLQTTANALMTSANFISTGMYALLDAIRGLQATASAQLLFLSSTVTDSATLNTPGGTATQTTTNNMIQALNKIVINTWATAKNTAAIAGNDGLQFSQGTLAGGGWIRGGIPGRDSVPLASGRHIGMPDEFVIRREIALANASWLPSFNETGRLPQSNIASLPSRSFVAGNDNSALLAEIRRLNARVESLEQTIKDGSDRQVRATVYGSENVASRVDRVAVAAEADARESTMKSQAAA